MSILKFVFILLEVLLLFNLLIFVHELGHYLAARWRGLKIERFAIWFGKPIWKKTINGVEFALGTIPAGGYVSLPQMATMETIEGKTSSSGEALPPISPLDKIIVAFAGPLFSFLLAVAFAVIVMIVGRPVSEAEGTTVVGYVQKDGPADLAGIKPGDRVLSVDGEPVSKFGGMGDSVTWRIVRSTGKTVPVKVDRDGQVLEFNPEPVRDDTKFYQRKSLRQLKIAPAQSAIIAEVARHSPAEMAGLKPGDEIVSLNGQKLYHFAAIGEFIEKNPQQSFQVEVRRDNQMLSMNLQPEKPLVPADDQPRLGVVWNGSGKTKIVHPGVVEQVRGSVMAMVQTFGALFARDSDIDAQHLGGAVKIMEVYYRLFDSENGWRLALWFSVLMNVNLAILNLLPIPVLDGGHILLASIEGVFRRAVSVKVISAIQTGCAVLLIGFMLYIAFYDLQELPWKRSKSTSTEVQFAPKPAKSN